MPGPYQKWLQSMVPKPQKFDPEGSGYNYAAAEAAGIGPDSTGHWPSRVPETGLILKGRGHETYHKTVAGEEAVGNVITRGEDNFYYSNPPSKGGVSVYGDTLDMGIQ